MQFLVNVIDDGQAEAAGRTRSATAAEQDAVQALNERLRSAGQWVFAGGLAGPAESVVVDTRSGDAVVTEGPVVDATAYVAGFWVLELPDVETARTVAVEAATACNRAIELRPLL